ncbi:adenosylcobalamin-dependent ribonucleoside-diphosphate reductase, partial [Candidatus Saccharibacteria bacterium]|nr:adenosylcobalamin-dependent ribonucleoside-diphosphate reductase [Candidatus Saccharibacteria bacterium]
PVGDDLSEIFMAVHDTAMIHKSGGGTGFSFSRLRPVGDNVKSTQGISSGPISFMRVFNMATEVVKQGGTRRGANMGILRVDHPNILDFITCKRDGDFENFNISVALTEEFMEAKRKGGKYKLYNPHTHEAVGELDAREVYQMICDLAWETGDPGIIFIDRMNKYNPTPNIGKYEATNPCGEQPLLDYEACNLGSINLSRMVKTKDGNIVVDYDLLKDVTWRAVRFLDNVIEVNNYPLPEIDAMSRANRKIGLGAMGLADLLIKLGIPYDTTEACELGSKIMKFINDEGDAASRELAKVRGAFPNFKGSMWDTPGAKPMRNATITTIAPTGTLSIIAMCSSGIEPLFALVYNNSTDPTDPNADKWDIGCLSFEQVAKDRGFYSQELVDKIGDHGNVQGLDEVPEDVRRLFVVAHDIKPTWHIHMQAAFQKYTDNAVSKTVNFPNSATQEDFREVYDLADELGVKGVTAYRDGCKANQPLNAGTIGNKAKIATMPKIKVDDEGYVIPRERPDIVFGFTEKVKTSSGTMYITINDDEFGPCEIFSTVGKAGGDISAHMEGIARAVSAGLAHWISPHKFVKTFRNIRDGKPPMFGKGGQIQSCEDAIGIVMEHAIELRETGQISGEINRHIDSRGEDDACPECGGILEHESGCAVCRACGYSKCM